MNEFNEMIGVVEALLHNFTFGVLWTLLGIIIVLSTIVIDSGKGSVIVKSIGFTAAFFFLTPGLLALILKVF